MPPTVEPADDTASAHHHGPLLDDHRRAALYSLLLVAGFDGSVGEFAVAYADANEADHAALVDAIDSGRVAAVPGV